MLLAIFPFHTVGGWERVLIMGLSSQGLHSREKLTELYMVSKSGVDRAYIEQQLFQNLNIYLEMMYCGTSTHTDV